MTDKYDIMIEMLLSSIKKKDWITVLILTAELHSLEKARDRKKQKTEALSVASLKVLFASDVEQSVKDEELRYTLESVAETIMLREECSQEQATIKAEKWILKKLKSLDNN